MICGKPCSVHDLNSDGTYAHSECLRPLSNYPVSKGKKGGNLYPSVKD